jgi:molecular chaperone GrpE
MAIRFVKITDSLSPKQRLAKKLTTSRGMSHEELHKEGLTDTGKEVVNEMPTPEEILAADETLSTDNNGLDSPDLLAVEKERYMRLYSDFDNFKKRTARERIEFLQVAEKDVILNMIPVLDDFERALKASEKLEGEAKQALAGFELIYKKMATSLETRGLKAMQSIGNKFDVELHEAVTKIPAPANNLKGKVVDELEKGYTLNDKVIRFAKVVIGE